ncbi:hypothetical protein [Maricaulis sp. CAU 1757]
MTRSTDPQARAEAGRQHAYGEVDQGDKPLKDQEARRRRPTGQAGQADTEAHGFLRDDGQKRPAGGGVDHLDTTERQPVLSPEDERHPNLPDMAGDDIGQKSADIAREPEVDRDFLKDAYSADKPVDEKA